MATHLEIHFKDRSIARFKSDCSDGYYMNEAPFIGGQFLKVTAYLGDGQWKTFYYKLDSIETIIEKTIDDDD